MVTKRSWVVALGFVGVVVSTPASAAPLGHANGEPEIERCIRQASIGKPWLEKTLWGLRDQEAGWIGAEIQNANGSHDLGVLQINSGWVPRLAELLGKPQDQIRHWLRFDPCFNTQVGRWIFVAALRQTGDYWKAVGTYHSPTTWRQRRYATSVAGHLRDRYGKQVFRKQDQ